MEIRLENENDYYEVENLTREAFWNVYRPGCFEHLVVHNLRKDKCFVKELDYVILENEKIIANIMYAKGNLKTDKNKEILLLGPVSVLPEYQRIGYGEKIIRYSMLRAKELGYNEVVMLGNPEYYKKFGFEPASKYNIFYEGMDKNEEFPFFMICILNHEKFKLSGGIYSDPTCYKVDEKELTEFDKKFSSKIKLKKQGQLE